MNASFVAPESAQVPPLATVPAEGFTRSSGGIRVSGPVTLSRTRSNFTPICIASVQPALSYGGVGAPPGTRKSSG